MVDKVLAKRYIAAVMQVPVTEMALRNRVREIRTALGLSQEEVARRAQISPTTLVHLENRDDYQPTRSVMEKVAVALHSSVGWVFFYERIAGIDVEEHVA